MIGAAFHGPITQRDFLLGMGIGPRLKALIGTTTDTNTRKSLMSAVDRLVNPAEMGTAYKFCVLTPGEEKCRPYLFEDRNNDAGK